MKNETIVAVSTPVGVGAISIVRLSGDQSLSIAKKLFSSTGFDYEKIEARKLYLGNFSFNNISDQCLMVYFKAPYSYTGEDLVEFQIHGSTKLTSVVVSAVCSSGARLASEGEFTKRAFINGKITLDKAEGVIDTINAQSENELRAANELVHGRLFQFVLSLQNNLKDLISRLEVSLDYPEHDIEYLEKEYAKQRIEEYMIELNKLIENSDENQFIKNGVNVAIVGKVNVGKSSLLNALLGENRAIVTDIEGTTRDIIKETITHKGLKINFIDTAGIRQSSDIVEKIGIEKSYQQIESSDIVLFVFDSSRKLENDEIETLEKILNKPHIIIANKTDSAVYEENFKLDILKNEKVFKISALLNKNVDLVKDEIVKLSDCEKIDFSEICLTNARHINSVKIAKEYLNSAKESCENFTIDIISFELKKAWNELGKITGETENEDIIDAIFSKFCLGK